MWQFNPRTYGPVVGPLLAKAPLNEIGPGTRQADKRAALESLTLESIVAPHDVTDRDLALCCCAALWLRFDFIEESHRISQAVDTAEGSLWHGILHRRETDFANAKYWFRRGGPHATFSRLADAARRLAVEVAKPDPAAAYLTTLEVWDPLKFVDLCDVALDSCPPLHTLCKRVQLAEWELLFDHCYRRCVAE